MIQTYMQAVVGAVLSLALVTFMFFSPHLGELSTLVWSFCLFTALALVATSFWVVAVSQREGQGSRHQLERLSDALNWQGFAMAPVFVSIQTLMGVVWTPTGASERVAFMFWWTELAILALVTGIYYGRYCLLGNIRKVDREKFVDQHY